MGKRGLRVFIADAMLGTSEDVRNKGPMMVLLSICDWLPSLYLLNGRTWIPTLPRQIISGFTGT
ncbi:hypothetical protein [Coleofasciculus sp. G2-EDA-02]|uniref:hypothetical protein n=1 Tax=Coleofasciculus sp. G2-EDA-02 TaxID=3069529 RepID=UPI0032FF147D